MKEEAMSSGLYTECLLPKSPPDLLHVPRRFQSLTLATWQPDDQRVQLVSDALACLALMGWTPAQGGNFV